MLTTKTIAAAQGSHYYTQDNYYTTEELQERSQWWGEGAAKVGLKGRVQAEDFQQLLEGKLPDGERLRKRKATRAGYKDRAALDCTFSAPKSVSLLALVKGDRQIEKAHREAVRATLQVMEERYATTRQRRGGGIRQVVRTGNLLAAQFHHDTNREKDPHLHTHCVLINATQTDDGRWYSLRNDEIIRYKKLLGSIYQNELAVRMRRLGYQVESRGNGQFEVQGFTSEQLDTFSQRRQQILARAAADSSWEERDAVWEKTRKPKGKAKKREELHAAWEERAVRAGIQFPKRRREHLAIEPQPELARKAVADGIEHCSERRTAFPVEAIECFALEEVGRFTTAELQVAVRASDELIVLDKGVTTHEAVRRELATIKLMKASQETHAAIAPDAAARLEGISLTAGQREAIVLAASNRDGVLAWQGVAGAGKTYALNQLKELVETSGHQLQVRGFAPSANAAKELEREMGIETQTVQRLLHSKADPEAQRSELWIVDEAGMLSARDAHRLLVRANEAKARVLLVGDIRQNSAVEAGHPFKSLQQAGMQTAYMNQSLRQKTPELKQAVDFVARGQIDRGYALLQSAGYVQEVALEGMAETVASDYLALDVEARQETLIIAERHVERRGITAAIRAGLKAKGTLGEDVAAIALDSRNLTRVQERYAHHFAEGDVVVPLRDYKRLKLNKGELYGVTAVQRDRLALKDKEGSTYIADPARFQKSAYRPREMAIAVGDKLKWTKNDRQQERRNGEDLTVKAIQGSTATVFNREGRETEIDLQQPQYLDHAWVGTTYSSQGKTANRALMVAAPSSKESFYVGISRVKRDLTIYAPDKSKLQKQAQESQIQENPLEVLQAQQRQQELLSYGQAVRAVLQRHGREGADGSLSYGGSALRMACGPGWVRVMDARSGREVLRIQDGRVATASLTAEDTQRFQRMQAAVKRAGPQQVVGKPRRGLRH